MSLVLYINYIVITLESCVYHVGQGMTSFMSEQGINELNIFIFVLAAMQIVYSLVTMSLGRAKVQQGVHFLFHFSLVEETYIFTSGPQMRGEHGR